MDFSPRREPEIVRLDADRAQWDQAVATADGGTFCHLAGWRDIMTDALGHECVFLAARSAQGSYEGVLPLVRMRSRLLGHHLISMPFLNYGGPLGTETAQRALGLAALAEARRLDVNSLELRSRYAMPQTPGLRGVARKVTVLLDLPACSDELWKKFAAKLRSQIRKPQKEGMEIRFGADQLEAFYDVFSRNMRDLGTPVLPRRLFSRIIEVFPDLSLVGSVYHQGAPVAAAFGFLWRGEFEMTWASSRREANRLAPNMLLYWAFMEEVIRRGARVFNFGRCTPGVGTHRFKQQWGGRDVPLPWSEWTGGESPQSTPAAERPAFRLASALWRRLPLAVANRLGPPIARRLSAF